jgi:HK97 family phage major capsid protein
MTDELKDLVYEFRNTLNEKNQESTEVKSKLSKIESELDKHEEKNQNLVKELAEKEKRQADIEEKQKEMESKLSRMPRSERSEFQTTPHYKAFENFVRYGKQYLSPEEVKYLRTDNDPEGGYLAPSEFVTDIIKKITEISPVRQVARIRQTNRHSIEIPKRENLIQGGWIGEGRSFPQDNSNYGTQVIKVNKMAVFPTITTEMLTDSAFNMEAEISQDIAEEFERIEGASFIKGNSVNQPEGLLTNPDVQEVNTGIANDITADAILELRGELKQGYQGAYMINRRTLSRIRRLKAGDGHYLWQPSLGQSQPNTINGEPYYEAIDVDDIEPGSNPVIYGDFMRGYTIVDSTQMSLLRDNYTLAAEGKVRFVAHRRVGGQVTLAEAIKKLNVAE